MSFIGIIAKAVRGTSDPVMEMYLAAVRAERRGEKTEKTRTLCRQTPIKIMHEP